MRLHYRTSTDELTLYRKKNSVIVFFILMMFISVSAGIAFIGIGFNANEFKYSHIAWYSLGAIFIIFSMGFLTTLPKHIKRLTANNGAIILRANKEYLTLAAETNGEAFNYSWKDIEKIYFARTYQQKNYTKGSKSWNRLVIYFTEEFDKENFKTHSNELIKRNQTNIWNAYNGSSYYIVGLPRKKAPAIIDGLNQITPKDLHIDTHNKVIVDYQDKTEQIISNS